MQIKKGVNENISSREIEKVFMIIRIEILNDIRMTKFSMNLTNHRISPFPSGIHITLAQSSSKL